MTALAIQIENLGKGIGNNCRYRIIQLLLKGRKTVGEIAKATDTAQPAVSQHLKVLKECQLVNSQREGKEVYYSVNTEYTLKLLKDLTDNVSKCPGTSD